MVHYEYRLFIIKLISQVFIVPPLCLTAILRTTSHFGLVSLPTWAFALFLLSATPVYWTIKNSWDNYTTEAAARRHGAKLAPICKGKKLGNLDILARLTAGVQRGYPGAIIDEFLDEVGSDTANLRILWQDRLITRDHHVAKFMLSTGFNSFYRGWMPLMRGRLFFGRGIFASDGDQAKMHRAVARPYFARERIGDYRAFGRYAEKTIALFRQVAIAGEPCDVQDLFSRFTLDTAGEFLFHTTKLNTLNQSLPTPRNAISLVHNNTASAHTSLYQNFANAMERAQLKLTKRRLTGYKWYFTEFFGDTLIEDITHIDAFINPLVDEAVAREKKRKEAGAPRPIDDPENATFIDHLVATTEDVQLLRDELLNVLLAARDTTACLLTFTCYVLALHPDVMHKLRAEVLDNCGITEAPTYDGLKRLKYLRAVLNEVLRLFPPVPLSERTSSEACVIPTPNGPLYIPYKNLAIIYSIVSIHRREDLWGGNKDEFDPERWLDGREKHTASDPFMFIPFNAGPRICLGQQFAYNEASFFAVRLLQTFDKFTLMQPEAAPLDCLPPSEWKKKQGRQASEHVWPSALLTLFSKGGMWIKMDLAEP